MKTAPLLLAALLGLTACSKRKEASQPPVAPPPHAQSMPANAMAFGTVVETFDAANYTYVRVKTASGEIWAAATPFKVSVGTQVAVPTDMPMENFHSSTLNRTFPVIYFTSKVLVKGEAGYPNQV
ncbi:MAG TPA: hypothetical protein VJ505_08225 [Holophagaceae bacterium]|nr:hypothetical protein [Holophagaceae bacterium]